MSGRLPPRRYWRAPTREDQLRSRREAFLPGLFGTMVLFAVLLLISWAVGVAHPWLFYGASAVWVVVLGFWVELRSARRRQAEDERA